MSTTTEESIRTSKQKRASIKAENESKRSSQGGFGKGVTSGSAYHKTGLKKRSAYGDNPYD